MATLLQVTACNDFQLEITDPILKGCPLQRLHAHLLHTVTFSMMVAFSKGSFTGPGHHETFLMALAQLVEDVVYCGNVSKQKHVSADASIP